MTASLEIQTPVASGFNPDSVADSGEIAVNVGSFWTNRQRQAHRLHEVSYRACFKPQLPQYFIDRFTVPGDTVYDPFMGRGTTLLQAALGGRVAVGNDINPLSAMLIRPRLNPPSVEEVAKRLEQIDWNHSDKHAPPKSLLAFYHPETLRQLQSLKSHFVGGSTDKVDDWIRMVAINRLSGHSNGFFSVYTMPPNQAVSVPVQNKINAKRRQTPPLRNVAELILKKTKALLAPGLPSNFTRHPEPILGNSNAEDTGFINSESIDLIVTSPPFLDVVNYPKDNWLRCWFAAIDPDTIAIRNYGRVGEWRSFVQKCFTEFARILRPNAHIAFEVGEVRNGTILLEEHVLAAIEGLPFAVEKIMINRQNFTKTSHCWGVANGKKGTNSNRILLAKKVGAHPKQEYNSDNRRLYGRRNILVAGNLG